MSSLLPHKKMIGDVCDTGSLLCVFLSFTSLLMCLGMKGISCDPPFHPAVFVKQKLQMIKVLGINIKSNSTAHIPVLATHRRLK